jgi:hypothetical protein
MTLCTKWPSVPWIICILSSPHFVLTSYRGIFFLCFVYFHLCSRRSEDAGHVPLTTRFVYITYFLEMLAFQVSFCQFIINNNKSQLLLQPYIPSHLINLKNQLRYRLLNMWKLFCVRLLSSFLDTNDNKVALPVVHRKKLWKARLKMMRILLFFMKYWQPLLPFGQHISVSTLVLKRKIVWGEILCTFWQFTF